MTNNNRKEGTTFEQELCAALSAYGFWCHNLAQNRQGQPFDVIASRNEQTHPIDCKVCAKNIFKMERVEQNQSSAMYLWRDTGNGEGWFALQLNTGEVYMISFSDMETNMFTKSVLGEHEIRTIGISLGEWVAQCK